MKAASLAELMRSAGITEACMRQTDPKMLHVENKGQGGAKMVAIGDMESVYADCLVGGALQYPRPARSRGRRPGKRLHPRGAGGDPGGGTRKGQRGGRKGKAVQAPPRRKETGGEKEKQLVTNPQRESTKARQAFRFAHQQTGPCSRSEAP
jgi:hypothetical protein